MNKPLLADDIEFKLGMTIYMGITGNFEPIETSEEHCYVEPYELHSIEPFAILDKRIVYFLKNKKYPIFGTDLSHYYGIRNNAIKEAIRQNDVKMTELVKYGHELYSMLDPN